MKAVLCLTSIFCISAFGCSGSDRAVQAQTALNKLFLSKSDRGMHLCVLVYGKKYTNRIGTIEIYFGIDDPDTYNWSFRGIEPIDITYELANGKIASEKADKIGIDNQFNPISKLTTTAQRFDLDIPQGTKNVVVSYTSDLTVKVPIAVFDQ